MYQKFEQLPVEKQQRIINAGLKEFSAQLYKNASTDLIATNAGISKGALFHYFKAKKQFYLYLYHYAKDVIVRKYTDMLEPDSHGVISPLRRDPVDAYLFVTRIKIEMIMQHPDIFDFMFNAYIKETDEELRSYIQADSDRERNSFMHDLLSDLDDSVIDDCFDKGQVINIIKWVVDGYAKQMTGTMMRNDRADYMDVAWQNEFGAYMATLKKAFYANS